MIVMFSIAMSYTVCTFHLRAPLPVFVSQAFLSLWPRRCYWTCGMTVWGRSDALHCKGIIVFHWSLSFLDLLFGIGRILDIFMQWWRSFAQGEEESVYSTHCSPYESSPCPCYTHVYLFLTARHRKSRRKDRTSALCCRGKTLAVNQHLVLACSYKNQSCFFSFWRGCCNLTLPGKEGHRRCLCVFSSEHEWNGW